MTHNHKQFAHLHVHSEYSLLDGLSRIKHLTARAQELNMPALALTDHGTMYGTIQFYRACKKAGIKPILGVESYLASRNLRDRDPELDRKRYHILLLAQNQEGYGNLLNIVSVAQLEGFYYRPRTDHKYLEEHNAGLITTTGCMAGEIPQAINQGQMKRVDELMSWYVEVFGRDRFFIELQEHSIPELTEINKKLLELASHYNLKTLATNDVHYTAAEEASAHDVLLCIQTGKTVGTPQRMRLSDQSYYLKSYDEMAKLFGNVEGALENSLLIAEMCDVNPIPEGYHLPRFEVPEGYTTETYLRNLCEVGLVRRYGQDRATSEVALRQRLDHELGIINRMGFAAYFLIVWDLCEFAREQDIWWNVRGSGAGSVVAYTLGITGIDPLANGLIFERFLNPGRVSMPDIDLDYPDDRRQEMIEYTIRKYGSDKVAQIITFGTMGARAAIRDVGRALNVPLPVVDEVAKVIPAVPGKPVTIENVLTPGHDFYRSEFVELYKEDEQIRELIDTAQSLEGVSRHASTHAAGVIIADKPLVEYTPLHRPTSGSGDGDGIGIVTQWPMEILDSIGLLKVDFLGLSTLTILRRAAELILKRTSVRYTMENIPYDIGQVGPDPNKKPELLFEMLGRGDVAGVFQVEGAGMRRLMIQMQPKRFDNIIAAISLYRPGPMENIPEYIDRMHGKKEVKYHDPDLEPILQDTYGILVYQEQIIRIAAELGGYEPGKADMIRKAVAKKKRGLMDQHRDQFTAGAMARGYSLETCEAIWRDIEFFARYGFNKAHAADYAVITCQTAFLKAHYPVEYMTALLSVERNNSEKVAIYLAETRRMNIHVAPPNINQSELDFAIEGDASQPVIRYGLGAIKNAGTAALELILNERLANGLFTDLVDLCDRVDLRRVGRRALESLIKVGVFDNWGTRYQILEAIERIIGYSGNTHEAAAVGQMSLFGAMSNSDLDLRVEFLKTEANLPNVDTREVLEWEKELVGVYITEHPVSQHYDRLRDVVTATTSELEDSVNGRGVTIVGLLTYLRTYVTKKGSPMAFGSLEDLHGSVELLLFPRIWDEYKSIVEPDKVYIVRGRVRIENDNKPKIVVESITDNLSLAMPAGEKPAATAGINNRVQNFDQNDNRSRPLEKREINGNQSDDSTAESQYPPPPPNFEPDLEFWNGLKKPGRTNLPADSESRGQTMVETGLSSPPSSAVEVPEEIEARDWNNPLIPDYATDLAENANPKVIEEIVLDESSRNQNLGEKLGGGYGDYAGGGRIQGRVIIVDVQPSANWQDNCRQIVKLVDEFEGNDHLRIRLVNPGFEMDFPNHPTLFCPELVRSIKEMASVLNVKVA